MDDIDFGVWQLQSRLVLDQLSRIEDAQREMLTALGWPTAPVEILDVLEGKRPAPARCSTKDRTRARFAMHALLQVNIVRPHLGPDAQNAPAAAYAAILATAFADEGVLKQLREAGARRSAQAAGDRHREKAARHDGLIFRLADEYARKQKDGSDSKRNAWIARRLNALKKGSRSPRTIARRLALRSAQKA